MKVGYLFLVAILSGCTEITSFLDGDSDKQTARSAVPANQSRPSQRGISSNTNQASRSTARAAASSATASNSRATLNGTTIKRLYSELKCPITKAHLKDPVMTSDGYTFERDAITSWLRTHNTNPATGNRLTHKNLVKNISLASILDSNLPLSADQKDQLFDCPISYTRMNDPVTLIDGHTFNRSSISRWLRSHNTNPMTNSALRTKSLLPNIALKAFIDTHS